MVAAEVLVSDLVSILVNHPLNHPRIPQASHAVRADSLLNQDDPVHPARGARSADCREFGTNPNTLKEVEARYHAGRLRIVRVIVHPDEGRLHVHRVSDCAKLLTRKPTHGEDVAFRPTTVFRPVMGAASPGAQQRACAAFRAMLS
jgi:hypothetical protein